MRGEKMGGGQRLGGMRGEKMGGGGWEVGQYER